LAGQKQYFTENLGLRISSHVFCQALGKFFKNPLVSTSANISGAGSIYSMDQIKEQFSGFGTQPDLLINAGNLPLTPTSTIIKSVAGKIEILRQGKIVIKE
jgi:L-threonylcarbamoyladenylate synthase